MLILTLFSVHIGSRTGNLARPFQKIENRDFFWPFQHSNKLCTYLQFSIYLAGGAYQRSSNHRQSSALFWSWRHTHTDDVRL